MRFRILQKSLHNFGFFCLFACSKLFGLRILQILCCQLGRSTKRCCRPREQHEPSCVCCIQAFLCTWMPTALGWYVGGGASFNGGGRGVLTMGGTSDPQWHGLALLLVFEFLLNLFKLSASKKHIPCFMWALKACVCVRVCVCVISHLTTCFHLLFRAHRWARPILWASKLGCMTITPNRTATWQHLNWHCCWYGCLPCACWSWGTT